MGRLRSIAQRRPAELLLASEALLLLSVFRLGLALVPVRRIIAAISRKPEAHSAPYLAGEMQVTARRVQWAVSAAARHSPVEFVCFPQALAGYAMLRRRHVPAMVVYGVARSAEGELLAHAWLTVGDRILLGGEAAKDFIAIEQWT
jgi:hypothetical protein